MGILDFGGGGGGTNYQTAINQIQGVRIPAVEEMRIQLEQMVSAGEISPLQAQNMLQEATAFEDMELDPYTREAQVKSLQRLQDIGDSEGMDAIGKSQLLEAREGMETSARGMREAGIQRAQERGIGGSGLELANQLLANQAAASRGSRDATLAAGDAQRRGLEAITQAGQLGGQIRGQDYGQEATKASAIDAINRFNTLTRQQTQEANIQRQSSANYTNLAERQRLMDYNAQAENQNRARNSNLMQQNFENQMTKSGALSNLYSQQAQARASRQQADRGFAGSLIGTVGTVVGGMYGGPAGAYAGGQLAQGGATGGSGGAGTMEYKPPTPTYQTSSYGPRKKNRLELGNQGGYGSYGQ